MAARVAYFGVLLGFYGAMTAAYLTSELPRVPVSLGLEIELVAAAIALCLTMLTYLILPVRRLISRWLP